MESKISNPYLRRVKENAICNSSTSCTMTGIFSKIMFFTLLTFVGICVDVSKVVPTQYIDYALITCAIVALITSLINFFFPAATPVLGSIFCLAEGYLIGWTCRIYSDIFDGIVPIALLITLMVVATMAFLYGAKIIKVNQRFKAVVSTLFLVSVLFSLVVFISSFFTNVLSNFFWGNSYLAIGIAVFNVVIAAAYLVTDFDNIAIGVSQNYPKKFEWTLAFGLVMSIIILFLRILRLVAKILSIASRR